jgi:acetyl esterase/lipase
VTAVADVGDADPPDQHLEEWFERLADWDRDQPGPATPRLVTYGESVDQVVDVWEPVAATGSARVVVSLHGGYFADEYTREIHTPLARALVRHGYIVWNVEYRRAHPGTGGSAETTADIEAAVRLARVSSGRPLIVLGHSAGGYLAEWVAAMPEVDRTISLAPATDLEECSRLGLDDGAVELWLGGTQGVTADDYTRSRLTGRWPTTALLLLVHGVEDQVVPVAQSRRYAARAVLADENVRLTEVADCGHYSLIDPRSAVFDHVLTALASADART